MRTRGARIADLAVLVVAADEGVKPQTKEAIQILKETKTPFVVAINKIDAQGADLNKVKNDLSAHEVLLEGYGGDISYQPISAKTGEGVEELLDLLLLAADVEGFSYDPQMPASGFVLEARTNNQRGLEAMLIVREGVLRRGDTIRTATASGKVKILENFFGKPTPEINASSPALVVGFEAMPQAGEQFFSGDEAIVQSNADTSLSKTDASVSKKEWSKETFSLIIKADDAGSLEALTVVIGTMKLDVPLRIVRAEIGDITERDVKFAISMGAAVIGFKSKVDKAAYALAQAHGVAIVTSKIVYELIAAIEKFIAELKTAVVVGTLDVLAVFNQKRLDKQLVGGKISKGIFPNKGMFHLERNNERIGSGRIVSLESGKKELPSVSAGNEAGIIVGMAQKIEVGDVLVVEKERKT